MRDLVIIGGGPAGMTAAVYAARKGLDIELISHDLGGQAKWSWSVENYMGFSYIKGAELMHRFEEHMRQFGFPVEYSTVTQVIKKHPGFAVRLEGGRLVEALAVLVATGKSPRHLDVPGEENLIGRGVSYCATCDAPIFAGMDVVVAGGGNSALSAAIQLLKYARNVAIVSMEDWTGDAVLREKLASEPRVKAFKYSEVTEVIGEMMVNAVRIRSRKTGDETILPVRGVFVEVGQKPNSSIVKGLVDLNEAGEIVIDCSNRTSVPGIFAAGDVSSVPEKQIIIAAGEGAKAALAAYEYIVRQKPSVAKAA